MIKRKKTQAEKDDDFFVKTYNKEPTGYEMEQFKKTDFYKERKSIWWTEKDD